MRNEDHSLTNREKVRQPKLGFTYCGGCDRSLVGDGQACTRCGWKNLHRRAPARDARKS